MDSWDIRAQDLQPHHPKVLRSDEEMRAILISLPAGERLQMHQTYERSYVLVAGGEVELSHDGGTVTGGPGLLMHFAPNERREISATSDARLLMMLSPWPGEGHPSQPRSTAL